MQKILLGTFIAALILGAVPVFAQDVSFDNPANQQLKITISKNVDAHVIHIVEASKSSQQLDVVRDNLTNLKITDEKGDSPQYAETAGDKLGFLIFPTTDKVLVEYDLPAAVTYTDDMWTWSYYYPASTAFYMPQQVDLVFANTNPINFAEQEGIRCHGCQVKLEYELEKTQTTKQIRWEDKKFDIPIITQSDVASLEFDQPNKSISFEITKADEYITLIVPLELLWNPYEVFLDGEKIKKHEFYTDGTNVWLNFKPNTTGTIEIIGVSAVPEFPFAAMIVLGAAMIFATRHMVLLKSRGFM